MTIQMKVDTRELDELKRDMQMLINDYPILKENVRRKLGRRTKALAKSYVVPRWQPTTGRLKQSIIMRKEGADTTEIIAEAPYAGFVELGTSSRTRKAYAGIPLYLRKGWGGNSFPWYTHPGSRPMRFMENAYNQIQREAGDLIQQEIRKFFKGRKF